MHDLRLTDMVHARVVRPPGYGAHLLEVDVSKVEALPGVLKVVRDGSFLGVIAGREYQAVTAMRALAQAARWSEASALPDPDSIYTYLQGLPARDVTILDRGTLADASNVLTATYHRPYQMHGAIGPACAVALFADDALTVWSHAQGMFPLRARRRRAGRARAREGPLHPHGRVGLLRPQRRRRCGRRCRAPGARGSGTAGARAVDARAGTYVGAVRSGDDRAHLGGARPRQDHILATRCVEQLAFDQARHRRQPARRACGCQAVSRTAAGPHPAARGRRGSQRHPDLHHPQRAGDQSFHSRHAAARLRHARARCLRQRIRHRELHG